MADAEGNFLKDQRVFCKKEVFEKRFEALREHLTGEFAGGCDCRLFRVPTCSGSFFRYPE